MNPDDPNLKDKAHIKGRSVYDRRSGEDRRKTYDLNYFLKGGIERRSMAERRRRRRDRRKKWTMDDTAVSFPEDI